MANNEEQDSSQKTEEPTYKRLQDARKKGQVATSREVNSWLLLFVGSLVLLLLMPGVLMDLMGSMGSLIEQSHTHALTIQTTSEIVYWVFWEVIGVLAIPFLLLIGVALFAGLSQNGLIFAAESIQPKIEKISPLKGLKRLFSVRQLLEFLKGIIKIAVVGISGVIVLWPLIPKFEGLVGESEFRMFEQISDSALAVLMVMLSLLFVIAVFDLIYQRFSNRRKMMMTRQEVKEEFKNTEGDPQIKARLRRIRQERSRKRMMQALPRADVVITNPTHYAVALAYDPQTMQAPVLLAKGTDELAARIREKAEEISIPLVENPPLARLLYDTVELEEEIPPEHYRVVAEIISYVWSIKKTVRQAREAA